MNTPQRGAAAAPRFSRAMLRAIVVGVAAMVCAGGALAQDYPVKPIKLIVPFAPGGGNDAIARLLGRQLSASLGQPVIIDNRAGAGGRLGVEQGLRAEPDGYTLTLISNSYAANPSLYPIKFDPIKDITPIGMIARAPLLVAVNPKLPARNIQELIALAKSRNGAMMFASSGQGGISHLATELFIKSAGVEMTHVPYKGTSPALTDTVAGLTDVFFSTPGAALPYMKAQRLNVLAVTTPKRSKAEPQIPTLMESGLPDYEVTVWYGVIAPKGLPAAIQQRLNQEINASLGSKEVVDHLKTTGEETAPGTPAAFMTQIDKEVSLWRKVVADAKIQVD